MFALLSTICDDMAQRDAPCDDKRMVDKHLNVAEKLDYIAKACGFTKKNELAKCIGVEPQNVDNWRKRNSWTKEGTLRLSKATGVSMDWLNDISDVAFPNGVKVKIAAPLPKRVERTEGDIDQARKAMLAFLAVANEKLPGLAEEFLAALASGVRDLLDSAAAAQAIAQSREAHQQAARKRAR